MHSLHLLRLGIALGLCFVMPPLVLSGEAEDNDECYASMPDDFVNITVALHNFYRAHVYPSAANMKKMVRMLSELSELI